MRSSIGVMVGCVVLLAGCNKHAAKDCDATFGVINITDLRTPTKESGRKAEIAYLTEALAKWDQTVKTIQTDEVQKQGSDLAAKLADRKRMLEGAQFIKPKEDPAPPAPSASSPEPLSSAEARKRALADAVKFGMLGLLGDSEKLPPEVVKQLEANAKEVEQRRIALIDWCMAHD